MPTPSAQLPQGFKLDSPVPSGQLPAGFTLDQPQAPEKFGSGLPFSKQMSAQEFGNQSPIQQVGQAFVHTLPKDVYDFYKYIPKAASEFAVSAGEVPTDIYAAISGQQKLTPTYNVPGVGKIQSLQSQALNSLNSAPTQNEYKSPISGKPIFTPEYTQYLNSNQPFGGNALLKPILKGLGDAAITAGALKTGKDVVTKLVGDYNLSTGEATPGLLEKLPTAVKNKAQDVLGNIQEGTQNVLKQNAIDTWEKPTTVPKASYKKATEIYSNASDAGNNISERLVNNGILPSENVTGKNWDTLDTAEQIRNDNGLASRDLLRPALEKASPGVQYVPTEDIVSEVKNNIGDSKYILPEDKTTLLNRIDNQIAPALATKYPDGMSLVDLHDEKILRDANAGYKWNATVEDNLKAQGNKQIADVLRNTLEDVAPDNIPVKAFNSELQKNYQMADYLESLNNKPIPKSVLDKLANTGAKAAGAATAQHLGGGLLVDVGGYHIGGMVENILSEMPGKIRDSLLQNLEQSNPEAFNAVSDAINQMGEEQASRLALPAPGQTTQNQINLPQSGVLKGQDVLRTPANIEQQSLNYNHIQNRLNDIVALELKDNNPEIANKILNSVKPGETFTSIDDLQSQIRDSLTPSEEKLANADINRTFNDWKHTLSLYGQSPAIQNLPKVTFSKGIPSSLSQPSEGMINDVLSIAPKESLDKISDIVVSPSPAPTIGGLEPLAKIEQVGDKFKIILFPSTNPNADYAQALTHEINNHLGGGFNFNTENPIEKLALMKDELAKAKQSGSDTTDLEDIIKNYEKTVSQSSLPNLKALNEGKNKLYNTYLKKFK